MRSDRRPGLFWPLILIGLGALLLLQNLGYLPAGLWAALAQLWPVVFILLGLDLLVGRRSSAGAAAVLVVGALVVIGALTWAALRAQQLPAGAPQTLAQPPQSATSLEVTISFDAGELSLSALGPSASALEGEVTNGPGESADLTYRVDNGGVGRLALDQRGEALLLPFLAALAGLGAYLELRGRGVSRLLLPEEWKLLAKLVAVVLLSVILVIGKIALDFPAESFLYGRF